MSLWINIGLPITPADRVRLAPIIGNYVTWSAMREETTEVDCAKLFIIEASSERRQLLLDRIAHRFNALRAKRELRELHESDYFRKMMLT